MRIIYIGRDPANDIVIKHPSVSGRHAKVTVEGDALWIEDLGSRNGTYVGDPPEPVSKTTIQIDARITLGESLLPANALRETLERGQPQIPADQVIQLRPSSRVIFGRSKDAGVLIDQPLVSARHAVVTRRGDRVIVTDLDSMSGTFVDDHRIDGSVVLKPGALLQIADHSYRLSTDGTALEPVKPSAFDIIASNVGVDGAGQRLLEGVSLVVQPGELVAIMGSSGAGKTVLLSVLNGQVAPSVGRVLISGHDLYQYYDLFRGKIGHVPQDDILHADLTVWQALWYAARLRLPKDMGDEEIANRINKVLSQLGLDGTENTRIGDQRKRGISGGQRKRVNLAMELLTDPPILVLDEPTSGLSSTDAMSVIELLRSLADSGKTILVAIHQPSLEVFQKFDAVAVVARDASTEQVGRLAYFGRAWPDAVHFFEPPARPGYSLPRNAEGLLRGLSAKPVAEWLSDWEKSNAKSVWVDRRTMVLPKLPIHHEEYKPQRVALFSQWSTLVRRALSIKAADLWSTMILILQAPLVGLLIGAVFSKVLRSHPADSEQWFEVGINLATTMFVMALAAIYFGCSCTAREIVNELPIYRRERMVGLSILAYIGSKVTVLVAVSATQCALLLAVVIWFCDLHSGWWELYLVLFASGLAGGAIGLFISATFRTVEAAAGILPLMLLPMIVLGGILVKLRDLPAPTRPLAAAMPSRWAFEGLVLPEAQTREQLRVPKKKPDTGEQIIPPAQASLPNPLGVIGKAMGGFVQSAAESISQLPMVLMVDMVQAEEPPAENPLPPRRFMLPVRQRIYDEMRRAATAAEAELRKAAQYADEKARQLQKQAREEFERKAAEMGDKARKESEQKIAEAKERFEKSAAETEARIRLEIEKKLKEARDEFEKRAKDTETRTRMEIDRELKAAEDRFKKRAEDAEAKTRVEMEARVKETRAEFDRKAKDAESKTREKIDSINASIEEKIRQIRKELQQEIADSKGAIVPSPKDEGKPPANDKGNGKEKAAAEYETMDMAENFFGRQRWRSPENRPLMVLFGMFLTGVVASGLVLRFKDPSRH